LSARVAIQQQVGDENHESAAAELIHHPTQGGLGGGPLPRLGVLQRGEKLVPVSPARPRRENPPDFIVEGDQTGRVPLPKQHEGQRRRKKPRIGELGEPLAGRAGPRHRAAGVEHQHRPEVGLFLVLLDVETFGSREQLPVDVARLVTQLVGPVLGEFDRESAAGGAVEAGQEAFHDPLGDDLDPAQAGDFVGIEKVEAFPADSRSGAHHGEAKSNLAISGSRDLAMGTCGLSFGHTPRLVSHALTHTPGPFGLFGPLHPEGPRPPDHLTRLGWPVRRGTGPSRFGNECPGERPEAARHRGRHRAER
jgi:hypothetical protein